MRHTGGSALGLISTKSKPKDSDCIRASRRLTIPSDSPLIPVKRILYALIS